MFRDILKKVKLFLRIGIIFGLPTKKKILLYDEIHASALKEIIKKDFNILELRDNKKIYFWIFLKQIFLLDFSFSTYAKNYIKFTSPEVIITFNDARLEFFELKNSFRNIYFIAVVNGLRENSWFKKNKKLKSKNLKCDYFFVLNKHYISKYEKIIKSKFLTFGHFRNNMVKIKKFKFKKQFLLISQVHEVFQQVSTMFRINFIGNYLIL